MVSSVFKARETHMFLKKLLNSAKLGSGLFLLQLTRVISLIPEYYNSRTGYCRLTDIYGCNNSNSAKQDNITNFISGYYTLRDHVQT